MNKVFVFVVLFFACCSNRGKEEIDLSKIEYHVLRFDDGEGIFDESYSYHYVTRSDIRKTEKILRKAIEKYNEGKKEEGDYLVNHGRIWKTIYWSRSQKWRHSDICVLL